MGLKKKNGIKIFYILILFVLYSFLLKKYDYTIKYLTNFLFIIFIFVNFIFGQLDFYAERFRLKDVFINFGIDFVFSTIIFLFLKDWDIFLIFLVIFLFQTIFRRLTCLKYVKKNNVLIFGSNHIVNNVQEDLINDLDYNYVGYISNNKSRATKYLLGRYKEFNESIQKKIDINQINEEWLLESNGFDILNNESQRNIKRGLDLIIAAILMVLASPIALIAAIIIKIESKGPIIFKQVRIGENGKKFKIYKFRSMKIHDEKKYPKYTLDNDDRITRFGKIMRKTRIDELPQLFCIMKGTMSFVGPRPEWNLLVEEYKEKIPYYNLRHMIKPGITGWAQVMYPYGESVEDAKRKLEYDLYYLKHQDLILDVLTIMKTAKTVIFGKGK